MGALETTKALLSEFSIALSRLNSFFSHSKNLHNARWAYPHELESLLGHPLSTTTAHLLLGVNPYDQPLAVRPSPRRRELGNLLIVAPTRGGKGLLAVSQLLTWPHSVIVNDIKGDLFTQTAGFRSTLGKVYVIDPTGVGHRLDPLQGRESEDELFSASTRLLYKPDEGDGIIFTERATVMLNQLFLAARLAKQPPFPYVRHLVRSGLLATAAKLDTLSPTLATQFLDTEFSEANLEDRFLLSCWSTLTTKIRPLLTETVIRSISGADFRTSDLMSGNTPVTLYLRWPERDLLALAPLVRLLWGSLIDDLITHYDRQTGKNCHPVLLLIDEAGRTAIPSLADSATTVVGRGLSLWVAVQSLSQLETVYGRSSANTLRDNMETQIFYPPGSHTTAAYLEQALGKKSAYAHSQTAHLGNQTSASLSEQAIPLMTAQDIKQLSDEDIIAFHRRLAPFKARRMDWRYIPLLAQRVKLRPPELHALPKQASSLPTTIWEEKRRSYIDPDERRN